MSIKKLILSSALLLGANTSVSIAGIPVVDVASIAEAVRMFQQLQQQHEMLTSQLNQLERDYDAMTGSRGLSSLINSEYDIDVASRVDVNSILQENNLKSSDEYGLSGDAAELLDSSNANAAMYSGVTHESLAQSQKRFNDLQGLIAKVDKSDDPKDVMDLQARIGAEQVFLQNELAKLQILQQQAEANKMLNEQQIQKMAIESAGELREVDW